MSDYMTLMGAEDVSRAGRQIAEAAESIRRAAGEIDEVSRRFFQQLDERPRRAAACCAAG